MLLIGTQLNQTIIATTAFSKKRRMLLKYYLLIILLITPCLQAADSHSVAAGATEVISEHGICRNVNNGGAKSIFIPTKTAPEWTSFRNSPPVSVTATSGGNCSVNTSLCSGTAPESRVQSDGKVIACAVARFNLDGTKDTSLVIGTGFNSTVRTLLVQTDNKIVAGGIFTSYNGTARNYIIRLNTDGTVDSGFNIGTGFDSYVFGATLQSDGKIIAAGRFGNYNGSSVMNVIRINTDGTRDTGFTAPSSLPEDAHEVAVQSDGKVLVVGDSYSSTAKNITRLNSDGTLDTTFNTNKGTATNAKAGAIASQTDGKVLVGGSFTSFNGTALGRFARLNADGTLDTTFNTNLGTGFNSDVESIAVQADGKILVVGDFTNFNGSSQNRIIRLNSDGTKDTGFTVGTGLNQVATHVLALPDGRIMVTGSFTAYNGTALSTSTYYVLRLNSDGTL